ncbi:MAG TPA: HlyD family secretion protein [Polyangiaceae bacterium]
MNDATTSRTSPAKHETSREPDAPLMAARAPDANENSDSDSDRAPKKARKAPKILLGLTVLACIVGGGVWVLGRGKESTDDAQVEGHVVTISVRTPGQVAKVLVSDNQVVKQDDILLELDPDELRARLAVARADRMAAEASLALAQVQLDLTSRNANANIRQARGGLSQATSGVVATKAQLEQTQADVASAESRLQLANKDLHRIQELFAQGSISQAELDARQAAADQATAGLELARARASSTRALISSNYGGVEQAQGRLVAALSGPQQVHAAEAQVQLSQARLEQTRAAERLAELNVSYGVVRAPVAGVVSRRNVEVGTLVSPDRPVMALVPLDDVWVVANFKEDQIGTMKPGQPTRVSFDTYAGRTITGQVESISAGTGARFALLPPDNATGNYVKVVQRIPVRIKLDQHQDLTLRPGMSAQVTVRVD